MCHPRLEWFERLLKQRRWQRTAVLPALYGNSVAYCLLSEVKRLDGRSYTFTEVGSAKLLRNCAFWAICGDLLRRYPIAALSFSSAGPSSCGLFSTPAKRSPTRSNRRSTLAM